MSDLNDILKYKKKILDNIYINTTKQSIAIQNEELESFGVLLSEREELITKLNNINSDNNIVDDDIKTKVKQICDIDKKNTNLIKKMQNDVDDSFKKMNTAKKVVTQGYMNYAGVQQQPAYFIDKKN